MSKLELQRAMHDKLSAFHDVSFSLRSPKEEHNAKPKKRVANREALNELAKDKFTRARQQHKPRHDSSKKTLNNDSDDEDGRDAAIRRNEDFVRRMEAAERARREQLRRTREEAVYLARVDKKECPSCGNPQSYSELTQKRKKCPNCGVTYKSRIAWSDVARDFLTRMEEFQQQCKEKQREKREEYERQELLTCKPEDDNEDTKKTWVDIRDEFLGRLQLDLEYREMSRAAIWEEIQRECSFSPSITRRAQELDVGDFIERYRRDLDERRLRREQIAARAEVAAAREREFERRNASSRDNSMPGGRNGGRQSTSSSSSSRHATPPAPFDRSLNEPPGRSGPLAALQSLQNKNVAVVGFLSTSSSSSSRAFAFANRVIGRCVFRDDEMQSATTVKDVTLPASIHLYYDDVARCIYLLGLVRPDSLCFSPAASKVGMPNSNSKNKPSARRQSTTGDEAEEQPPLNEAQRIRKEMDTFEREKLKMQDARVTTNVLKDVRALAVEKTQLQSFVPTSTKHSKRDSNHSKGSSGGGNAFAPGRCVPLGSGPSRSATVTYCKSLETRLVTLFRSLRGSTVGSCRMRDALSAANLSKERRVFNLDPAHSVVVVSRRTATTDGRAESLLENLLDALDSDISADDVLNDDSLLQPLADDDMGLQRLNQYVQKYLDLLFSFSPSGSKDGGRTELLSPPQWLKVFHGLTKSYSRLDSKRRQEAAALEALGNDITLDYLAPASLATYHFDSM
ncbi:hypothetical protein GQ600_166 [Phytophthora cactorum]|nr:hypothetical protein GQ600_166 [Phytophthora cactorum]